MNEVTADAPGRVNLIGEHTDYHQGFVLPTVIAQRTRVYVTARSDGRVRAESRMFGREVREYVLGAEAPTRTWLDYIQGVTFALRTVAPDLSGFAVVVESDVPVGSGLASSAALEVSLLRALRALHEIKLDDVDLARLGQHAETSFVGAPVGIMDQMACSLGREHEALFLDTRSLSTVRIPLPKTAELVVINSGISHRHADGAYAARRRESFEAARLLGVKWLREVEDPTLVAIAKLPAPLAQRARHVVTENRRVQDAAAAMAIGDLARVGSLFQASHVSMRDDYEITAPEIDRLVALGQTDPDVYGARMTGGGFGGSVVMLAREGMGSEVARRVLRAYHAGGSKRGTILLPRDLDQSRTA